MGTVRYPVYVGDRYGRLVIVNANRDAQGKVECVCDCGTTKAVTPAHLRDGDVRSCGCFYRDLNTRLG